VCVCSLKYPDCNRHAPYCRLWPAQLCNIFPHCLINGTIFTQKIIEYKMWYSSFSTTLSELFLILRRTERDTIKNLYCSSWKVRVFLSDFNKTEFSRLIFEKYSNIKFNGNPSSRSRVVPYGHDEGRTDTT